LVVEVMREGIAFATGHVRTAVNSLAEAAPSKQRMETAMRAHLEALHASHDRAGAVVRVAESLPRQVRLAFRREERDYVQLWLQLVESLVREGQLPADADAEMLSLLLIGALNSTFRAGGGGRLDSDRVIATLLAVLFPAGSRLPGGSPS